ncbi:kelch-like protein 40b [Paramacrobiotus metropolitanus]|uniref:kelch-like protein 40b n=1 Tax=Paramacrobiotus metropolitanus TaxID=2943436 RepID=UPI002445930C|nr:kelch-like protein 40b [Paramacrobiotus metropolitanus]
MSADQAQPSTDPASARPSVDSSVVQGFLEGLQELKSSGVLCDVILKGAEDSSTGIPCHRVVLIAHSGYFRSMFSTDWKESSQVEIPLQNISFNVLSNCLQVYCLAQTHNNPHLADKAKALACQNFVRIASSIEFLQLDGQQVIELTASDDLSVEHEDEVFEAVKRWSDYEQDGRKAQLSDVLQHILF